MKKQNDELIWLCIDTEWSYAIYYLFPSKRPQYAPAKNIKHRQFCPNASWKFENKKKVNHVSVLDDKKQFKKDFRNDKVCAVAMHAAMSLADVIVAHNLDNFDLPMLNVIFALYGLGPIPEKKFVDTLKVAKKHFRFSGNGLDDLLKFFGHSGKAAKPDWVEMTEGNPIHIKKSVKYCDRDVAGLEIILKILRPYMRNIPKIRTSKVNNHYGIIKCESCGSLRLHNKNFGGKGGAVYPRVRCSECGHEHKGSMKLWRLSHQ